MAREAKKTYRMKSGKFINSEGVRFHRGQTFKEYPSKMPKGAWDIIEELPDEKIVVDTSTEETNTEETSTKN